MSSALITESRLEKALRFIAETDDVYAAEKAAVERSEILRKRARSRVFLTSDGTVAERQATAETHPDVVKADEEYIASVGAFEKVKARRQREELVVEVWRSLESSRRRGMV